VSGTVWARAPLGFPVAVAVDLVHVLAQALPVLLTHLLLAFLAAALLRIGDPEGGEPQDEDER
jgi:hypothetical protein